MSDQSAFCPKCGQPRGGEAAAKKRGGIVRSLMDLLDDYSAQSWPIMMVILLGLGLMVLLASSLLLKLVGVFCIIYAVRELLRWYAAKKAGEQYTPLMAKVGYLVLVVLAVALVANMVLGPLTPVSRVKGTEFDGTPGYTVEQIIDRSLSSPKWSSESGDDCDYVYVYGKLDGELVGFEFKLTSHGEYDYVSISNVLMDDQWLGEGMAALTFLGLYGDM